MYYDRTLTTEESLYVSRAQQKIAELGVQQTEQASRNDLDDYLKELSVELQYSIGVLMSTDLDWSKKDIQMMMDYYTLRGNLAVYPLRTGSFPYTQPSGGCCGGNWATLEQLAQVDSSSKERDNALSDRIDEEQQAREDADQALSDRIDAIPTGDDSILESEIVAEEDLGGVGEGATYPENSVRIETVVRDLLKVPTEINSFEAVGLPSPMQVGTVYNISAFTWSEQGDLNNKIITDSENIYTSPSFNNVDAYSVPGSADYTKGTSGNFTVTITSSENRIVGSKGEVLGVLEVPVVYPTYYGPIEAVDDTPVPLDEAAILSGTIVALDYNLGTITVPLEVTAEQQGFIAVHSEAGTFGNWKVSPGNESEINATSLIKTPTNLLVGGETYIIYQWGYRSETSTLTLY